MFAKTPKPPIPLMKEKELVLNFFTVKEWMKGKHLWVGRSVEHPSKPKQTGMFSIGRAEIILMAVVIEQGQHGGSKMTEFRHF